MVILPYRLCLTQRKLSSALMDAELGNQLLGRHLSDKEEPTASLQRSVLTMCLAGGVEVSYTMLREAVRLSEYEALGLQVLGT